MATRSSTTTTSRTDLVNSQVISLIRPRAISYTVTDTKPNTRLYAFFDGVSVDKYITPTGLTKGSPIVTDASGAASGTFDLPGGMFNTGTRVFRVQDTDIIDLNPIPGSTSGYAIANYTASGILNSYRTTYDVQNTIVNVEEQNIVAGGVVTIIDQEPTIYLKDPLAQSFFTYGIKGGCFVTKINIFFQSKDANLPVTLELRKMVNGYPSVIKVERDSFVTLKPSQVNLAPLGERSTNATVATSFVFPRPIYLEEDKDYCFVLLSNSNNYNVWTSKLSEKSIETGKTIFEQPFVGTLYKSENNITWTAEQTEDIKFTLFKAQFDISQESDLAYAFNADPMLIYGSTMSVTSGWPIITVKFKVEHAHSTGEFVTFTGLDGANYRGIPANTFNVPNGFAVSVIDDHTLSFNCGVQATSTGTLDTTGFINAIIIDKSGSGYINPSITISAPESGTTATAELVVVGGKIVDVNIINPGSGYLTVPSYSIIDSSGVGAELCIVSEAVFVTTINRKFQNVSFIGTINTPSGTGARLMFRAPTKVDDTYIRQQFYEIPRDTGSFTMKDMVLVNRDTEVKQFGTMQGSAVAVKLSSTNPNVSPTFDTADRPRLRLSNFLINDESNAESELSSNSGTARARYLSKIVKVATPSTGARVFVKACSTSRTSFAVYIRTSLSGSSTPHTNGSWSRMACTTNTNLSPNWSQYLDYQFDITSETKTGTITTLTNTSVVTGVGTEFTGSDIGKTLYTSDGNYIGTINSFVNSTSVILRDNALSANSNVQFSTNGIVDNFDTYDIKIVLFSPDKFQFPKIDNYRCIILAT
jgi:hypothetical protein